MLGSLFSKKSSAKKVLVVEDDALLSKVLAKSLVHEDFQVEVVDNGMEAVGAAINFKPDIILLDLVLPGLDGFAVLKELKSETKTKHIPVIVLSNLSEVGDVKSTKALGAKEYFIKSNTDLKKIIDYAKDTLN